MEILRYLVSHPQIHLDVVDNAQSRQTALHKLAQKLHDASTAEEREKHLQCLQILLASSGRQMDGSPSGAVGPINVNAQDAFGNTALHYAAFSGEMADKNVTVMPDLVFRSDCPRLLLPERFHALEDAVV